MAMLDGGPKTEFGTCCTTGGKFEKSRIEIESAGASRAILGAPEVKSFLSSLPDRITAPCFHAAPTDSAGGSQKIPKVRERNGISWQPSTSATGNLASNRCFWLTNW